MTVQAAAFSQRGLGWRAAKWSSGTSHTGCPAWWVWASSSSGRDFSSRPRTAAAAYGIAVGQDSAADAYLAVKGVRDIASGLFVFILLGARATHALGWVLLAAAIIPVGDSIIVLAHGGSKAIAYGIHAATAALLLVTSVLLLVSPA